VTAYLALGPLGLIVSALCAWSLFNAWTRGRVRSHGWKSRADEPGFFWLAVIFQALAGIWFGFIGLFVTAYALGLIAP
jgi:hypothetical protein